MKTYLLILIAVLLAGCATQDYRIYSDNQAAVSTAKYKAIEAIAANNPNAAAFALMGGGGNNSDQMRAPESAGETVLRYLGVLAAPIAQMYGAHQATRLGIAQSENSMNLGIAQSNNSTALGASTNAAFVGIAGKIQAPMVPQANITTTTTLSGAGVIGNGSYATQANPTTTTNANRNCSGAGAGSGSTSGTTNPSTGAGGSGSASC